MYTVLGFLDERPNQALWTVCDLGATAESSQGDLQCFAGRAVDLALHLVRIWSLKGCEASDLKIDSPCDRCC